jgi:hypothetical protein
MVGSPGVRLRKTSKEGPQGRLKGGVSQAQMPECADIFRRVLRGSVGLGARRHCCGGRGGIRIRDLAFERGRGVPREWTQVDVERGNS